MKILMKDLIEIRLITAIKRSDKMMWAKGKQVLIQEKRKRKSRIRRFKIT